MKLVHGGLDSFNLVSTSSGLPVQQQGTFTHTLNQAAAPAATTMQNAATANGNGTNLNVAGYATAILCITTSVDASGGTTMNFEASTDDTTFVAIYANQVGTSTIGTTALNNAMEADWEINCAGYKSLRARISAYSAGTITVKGYPIPLAGTTKAVNAVQSGTWNIGTVTAVTSLTNALPAGNNNIGDVDVASIAAGNNNIGDVDIATMPSVTLTNSTTGPQKAEDVASADADVGIPAMAVRKATPANTSGADGDYEFLQMSVGRLWTSSTIDAAIPAGTNNIGDMDVLTVVTGTGATNLGKAEDAAHASGDTGVYVLARRDDTLGADSGTDGDYESFHTTADGALWVTATPSTTGGWTTFHLASAASTNATSVKNAAGTLGGWYVYNSNAAARKLAFHNTSGTPTAGSSIYFSIVIPATAGANVEFTNGIPFSTGIGITTVTGLADSDSTAVAANDLIINLWYK